MKAAARIFINTFGDTIGMLSRYPSLSIEFLNNARGGEHIERCKFYDWLFDLIHGSTAKRLKVKGAMMRGDKKKNRI